MGGIDPSPNILLRKCNPDQNLDCLFSFRLDEILEVSQKLRILATPAAVGSDLHPFVCCTARTKSLLCEDQAKEQQGRARKRTLTHSHSPGFNSRSARTHKSAFAKKDPHLLARERAIFGGRARTVVKRSNKWNKIIDERLFFNPGMLHRQ